MLNVPINNEKYTTDLTYILFLVRYKLTPSERRTFIKYLTKIAENAPYVEDKNYILNEINKYKNNYNATVI